MCVGRIKGYKTISFSCNYSCIIQKLKIHMIVDKILGLCHSRKIAE